MADTEEDFHALMDPIFEAANATPTRAPLPYLYDTKTAASAIPGAFIGGSIVGAFYAKMLV